MPEHRRLRAPNEDGGVLLDPPAAEISKLLAENAARWGGNDSVTGGDAAALQRYDVQGCSLGELAKLARRELLSAAHRYSVSYGDVAAASSAESGGEILANPLPSGAATPLQSRPPGIATDSSISEDVPTIISGHQPELFHPGVWAKHFVADRLASTCRGVAINLLIDSDIVRGTTMRVPGGSVDRPFVESIPYDTPVEGIAYEEYCVRDRGALHSFGRRAGAVIAPLVPQSLVGSFWDRVIEASRQTDQVGLCFAQARHSLERSFGLTTLELPQSYVCQMESFYWFTAHLLAHLPRFWDIYNSAVQDFRCENRIRSTAHPVPDLAMDGEWLEAPFWLWDRQNPSRRRLFVRGDGDGLLLTDLDQWQTRISISPDADASDAVMQLGALARTGVKIRTRALVTTMFARLFLADLFIHGIGGAKYDQVTDKIIRQFFDLRPPRYLTMSTTLRLPTARVSIDEGEYSRISGQLHDLLWHPEVFLEKNSSSNDTSKWQPLIEKKRAWIATEQTAENARQRFLEIRNCNANLQKWVEYEAQALRRRREQLRESARIESVLGSREYSFCLHPEENLRELLLDNVRARL
ncbi:MAG: hypothetical protein VX988_07110 [Planctomycetota bacterium]|nr:hypothetical protein [Planctomycetota bacterium]